MVCERKKCKYGEATHIMVTMHFGKSSSFSAKKQKYVGRTKLEGDNDFMVSCCDFREIRDLTLPVK